jgi:hypothetical protein
MDDAAFPECTEAIRQLDLVDVPLEQRQDPGYVLEPRLAEAGHAKRLEGHAPLERPWHLGHTQAIEGDIRFIGANQSFEQRSGQ